MKIKNTKFYSKLKYFEKKIRHIFKPSCEDIFDKCILDNLKNEFYFVQIGANDGLSDDPINHYILKYNWSGVLVEPLPDLMDKLRGTYSDMTKLIFENSAISPDKNLNSIKRVNPAVSSEKLNVNLVQGLASLTPEKNILNKDKSKNAFGERISNLIQDNIIEEKINVITFSELIEKHKINQIDLLQIDVEGYDFTIVNSIDFSICKPRIIHTEFYNLYDEEKLAYINLLKANNYKILYAKKDILAVLS